MAEVEEVTSSMSVNGGISQVFAGSMGVSRQEHRAMEEAGDQVSSGCLSYCVRGLLLISYALNWIVCSFWTPSTGRKPLCAL